jgi:hypothetical protein
MTKSDDSRKKLEAEYIDAVKQTGFQSGIETRLLHPERIAKLSDDNLEELIQRYKSIDVQLIELLQLERKKTPQFFDKDEPERQSKYFGYWLRYFLCAGSPIGALVFLFFAKRISEKIGFTPYQNAIASLKRFPRDELLILSGRVDWAVFNALFYAAVCATGFFGILYIIPKALEKHFKFSKIVIFMVVIPVTALGVGLINNELQYYLPIPKGLLEQTVNEDYKQTGCFPFYEQKTPVIQCITERDEFGVYATHAFLTWICSIIIYAAAQDTKHINDPKAKLDQIERRLLIYMRLLRLSLYLGAAVLVTEILNVSALLHWPLAYLDTQSTSYGRSIDILVSSLMTERAVNYTGFLALLYIPSFLVFKWDAYRVACRKLPKKSLAEREAWLKEHGIAFSAWELLPRAIAILGPVLSTPVSELIRRVLG